jgi:DNA-binding NarL/FixJ family response regulator
MRAKQAKTRVLWVDDNVDLLEVYQATLPFTGDGEFEHVGFVSTLDHLEDEITNLAPNIVVLDYVMPGRRSLELMRQCLSRFPAVKFVIVSGHDNSSLAPIALAAGASAFMSKRGDMAALIECLRRVANGQREILS